MYLKWLYRPCSRILGFGEASGPPEGGSHIILATHPSLQGALLPLRPMSLLRPGGGDTFLSLPSWLRVLVSLRASAAQVRGTRKKVLFPLDYPLIVQAKLGIEIAWLRLLGSASPWIRKAIHFGLPG